ncbi:MAG: ATP synthase subunit I [Anaeromusa sp.]|uniref:ATP synthase subunit I n=1 Tax=Anaeromusa sp. TaxID=1872520 RepID=UPI002B2102FF|nr:ATP synthase subunit I [Anaeromusa sp.]MEA4836140.1 ATP synthase subunit I [Anaeromusa sp.]
MGSLLGAVLAGSLMGGLFFGGLWWTVQKATHTKHTEILLMASFVLRAAVLLGIGYAVCGDDFVLIFGYLGGFIISRGLAMRMWKDGAHPALHGRKGKGAV